jgi:hypothetical protein
MPLVKQRISFPFTAGQEQGIAAELVDPPMLLRATDCMYTRQGELAKRPGWRRFNETVDGGGYLPMCDRFAKREDELLWIGEQRSQLAGSTRQPCQIFSRVAAESAEETPATTWRPKGRMPRFGVERIRDITHGAVGERIAAYDCAYAGDALYDVGTSGVVCIIWQYDDLPQLDWATVDVATGSVLGQGTITGVASVDRLIRVVALKGSDGLWFFHAFWGINEFDGTAHLLHSIMPAAQPWSWLTPDTIVEHITGFDVCVSNPSAVGGVAPFERRMFICTTTAASEIVRCELWRPGTLGSISSSTSASHGIGNPVAPLSLHCVCDPNGQHVAIFAYSSAPSNNNVLTQFNCSLGGSGVLSYHNQCIVDSVGQSTLGGQVGWVGTTTISAATRWDNWFVAWQESGKFYGGRCEFVVAAAGTGMSIGGISNQAYATPWSRIISLRGEPYHLVLKGTSPDAACVEALSWNDDSDRTPLPEKAARFAGGEVSFAFSTVRDVPYSRGRNSIVESWYERGRFFTVVPVVSSDGTEHRLALFSLSAVDKQLFGSAEIGRGAFFSTGVPWAYDGNLGHELGFSVRPQTIAGEIAVQSTVAGPPYLAAGTYWVAMTFEATDSMGRTTRSSPSIAGPRTIGANANLSVTYLTVGHTSHRNLTPVLYVSNDGGINYIRSSQVIADNPFMLTDTTFAVDPVRLFQFGAPRLYTSDGIMSNAVLGYARFICEWQGRLWLMWDNTVWPSREIIDGEEPSWNESTQFKIPSNGTGMCALDDRLVLFCKDRIYWISGDGPTDTGQGGSFSLPQRIAPDFGCIDARSIVRTERGILFQSRRGIELLDGSMTVALISGGVDRVLREDGYLPLALTRKIR